MLEEMQELARFATKEDLDRLEAKVSALATRVEALGGELKKVQDNQRMIVELLLPEQRIMAHYSPDVDRILKKLTANLGL